MDPAYRFSESGAYYSPEPGSLAALRTYVASRAPPAKEASLCTLLHAFACCARFCCEHALQRIALAKRRRIGPDPLCGVFALLGLCPRYIEELPVVEFPEAYGLHANASITFELKETRGVRRTTERTINRTSEAEWFHTDVPPTSAQPTTGVASHPLPFPWRWR